MKKNISYKEMAIGFAFISIVISAGPTYGMFKDQDSALDSYEGEPGYVPPYMPAANHQTPSSTQESKNPSTSSAPVNPPVGTFSDALNDFVTKYPVTKK
jgi:hypothetical protein